MKMEELENKVKKLSDDLKRQLPIYIKQVVGFHAAGMISHRVITKQTNARGAKFSKYSSRPMLTSGNTLRGKRVWAAMAASKSKRRDLNWVTIKMKGKNVHLFELKGGYAQLRKIEGFGNTHKSFEYTGEMWDMFGVKRSKATGDEVVLVLGGKNMASQQKMDRNTEREGVNIIDISDKELESLARMIERKMQQYVNKQGLQ